MPTRVSIISIIENNKSPIDFYIMYSTLKEEEIELIKGDIKKHGDQYTLKTIKINDSFFSDLPIYGRSKVAYFRLLIPNMLPKDIDRCLYLDGDTVIQKSLQNFYNNDFEGKALVVNEDMGEAILYHKERHPVLKIPLNYKYFNSGVLMFNLEWFRNNFNTNTAFDWIKNNPDKLKFYELLYENLDWSGNIYSN